MKKLNRDFFARNTLLVAQELLGKEIIFYNHRFLITETEAYKGQDDLACHAARGKTPRNAVMFGPPGYSYVYFIYGMYFCLNFVTEKEGYPAAVLIRGAQALNVDNKMLNGPGKLCRYFGITKEHSAVDIIENKNFYVRDVNIALTHDATPRIGISMDTEKLWRFVARKVQERKTLA